MSRNRSAADWREDAALGLLAEALQALPPQPDTLIALDREERLRPTCPDANFWHRHARSGITATPWPATGPWPRIALRLPKAKAEQDMLITCLAARLAPDGELLIAAANDEGAKSLTKRLKDSWQHVTQLALGKRCRVLRLTRPADPSFNAEDWQLRHKVLDQHWISWPGLFAAGRIDAGTALLLDNLPDTLPASCRMLDYGCGTGIIAAHAAQHLAQLQPICLDTDTLALEATRLNLPQAQLVAADNADPASLGKFDLILSNPPFHTGKGEDLSIFKRFCTALPQLLNPGAEARLVLQSKLRLDQILPAASVIATTSGFAVWRLRK